MDIGISTSCYYPDTTENAFETLCAQGAKTAEIFFNSFSELDGEPMRKILCLQKEYGVRVACVHPFTCFAEPFILFDGYLRRQREGLDLYKNYFECAAKLGAAAIVLHGGYVMQSVRKNEKQAYIEAFGRLSEIAKEYGVIPAHENVVARAGENIGFLKELRSLFPGSFALVLDIKQSRRSGISEFEYIKEFSSELLQLHLSDCAGNKDCIVPGTGEYDFKKLFEVLRAASYRGDAVIELYKDGFKEKDEIKSAMEMLKKLNQSAAGKR